MAGMFQGAAESLQRNRSRHWRPLSQTLAVGAGVPDPIVQTQIGTAFHAYHLSKDEETRKAVLDPGGIFSTTEQGVEPRPLPEPEVMPIPDDAALERQKRRAFAAQRRRQGRASTMMTGGDGLMSDGLGG